MPLALKSLADLNPPPSEVDREAMLTIAPGTSLVLHNISWAGFEKLMLELGDIRAARITTTTALWKFITGQAIATENAIAVLPS